VTALSDILQRERSVFTTPIAQKAFEPKELAKVVSSLPPSGGERPEPPDLADVQHRVVEHATKGTTETLSRRDVKLACQSFLSGPLPPGRNRVAAEFLINAAEAGRRTLMQALIDAYLDHFEEGDPDVARLGSRLTRIVPQWPWRPSEWWAERAMTFAIFDSSLAPRRVHRAVLDADMPIPNLLRAAGLDSASRMTGGLARAGFEAACRETATLQGPASMDAQSRLIAWAGVAGDSLAYQKAWPAYAEALMAPWNNGEPPQDHKRQIMSAVLAYGGDPRLHPIKWAPLRSTGVAYNTLVRWLTKASLEQFFEIVSRIMHIRPDMWDDRRQFWTRYLPEISEAWVAFCPDGAELAETIARQARDASFRQFGRCATGNNRTREHAALIMKIGDLTVVDWSHNGEWNIWPAGSPSAPKLFKHGARYSDYTPADLMNGPIHGRHDPHGHWRMTVENHIYNCTGRRPWR
jgi:hypothetical protein